MSHMSLEWDPMPLLLARLREVCDISHINHLEGGGLSKSNKVVPVNTPSLESQVEELRRSVQSGVKSRAIMEKKIKSMAVQLETANGDNHRLEGSLKKAKDDNHSLEGLLTKADLKIKENEIYIKHADKRMIELQTDLKSSKNLQKDTMISRDNALRKYRDTYNALVSARNNAEELEGRLKNADYEVKSLKGFKNMADDTHEDFKRKVLRSVNSDKREWATALERIRTSEDKIKKREEENLNLLLSLKRAQEIIVSVSTFIKRIGDPGHPIQYPPPVENARDANTRTRINPSEKKNLLVERFRRLNDGLVQSSICDSPIYNEFILGFQAAIDLLCEKSLLRQRGQCVLYEMYAERDFISDSTIQNVKRLTLAAFAILHTIAPRKPPRLDNFRDFSLQIYREFENILCIFEGIEQNRTLNVNDIPGYGVHVFWEQTRQERERANAAMKAVG